MEEGSEEEEGEEEEEEDVEATEEGDGHHAIHSGVHGLGLASKKDMLSGSDADGSGAAFSSSPSASSSSSSSSGGSGSSGSSGSKYTGPLSFWRTVTGRREGGGSGDQSHMQKWFQSMEAIDEDPYSVFGGAFGASVRPAAA